MSTLSSLSLAVVGHLEWMSFLQVDQLPQAGRIAHAPCSLNDVGGAGAIVAVQMARVSGTRVKFFTALGRDAIGERSVQRLQELNVEAHVAWRDAPTRHGFSMVDGDGERAITVVGERLQPQADDPLPWDQLRACDGVFASAADAQALVVARQAKVLTATPRLRQATLQDAAIHLDALIGSGLDPDEQLCEPLGFPTPRVQIATEGDNGGRLTPGGRYIAAHPPGPMIDSYGCGDSFAAGVTVGLAAGWTVQEAVALGADIGARCTTWQGPYPR